jgi:hypothetical protein
VVRHLNRQVRPHADAPPDADLPGAVPVSLGECSTGGQGLVRCAHGWVRGKSGPEPAGAAQSAHPRPRRPRPAPAPARRLWERGNCMEQSMEQLYSEVGGVGGGVRLACAAMPVPAVLADSQACCCAPPPTPPCHPPPHPRPRASSWRTALCRAPAPSAATRWGAGQPGTGGQEGPPAGPAQPRHKPHLTPLRPPPHHPPQPPQPLTT